jgi:hypothetical protein
MHKGETKKRTDWHGTITLHNLRTEAYEARSWYLVESANEDNKRGKFS